MTVKGHKWNVLGQRNYEEGESKVLGCKRTKRRSERPKRSHKKYSSRNRQVGGNLRFKVRSMIRYARVGKV